MVGNALIRELETKSHKCPWDCVSPILVEVRLWASFFKHLKVIKTTFCYDKTQRVDEHEIKVFKFLNVNDFDCQQEIFKHIMKLNATTRMPPPFDVNPLI